MSIVIGLITHNGKTLVASDQLVSEDYVARVGSQRKAFYQTVKDANGTPQFEMIFGVVGVPAVISTLTYNFTPPPYTACLTDANLLDEYVYGSLIPSIAQTEKVRASQWGLDAAGFGLLIAAKGHIWSVDSHYNAVRFDRNFDVVGSGEHIALGALYALDMATNGKLGKPELVVAIESAIALDSGCGGRVEVLEVS
jgi:hypothetical protein